MLIIYLTILIGAVGFSIFPHFGVEGGVIYEKVEMCPEPKNPEIKMYCEVDNSNGTFSILNGNLTFSDDAGDQYVLENTLEAFIMNKWVKLFHIKEKNFCTALKKYMGQNLNEFQRRCNMVVGACPLRKGKYQFKNFIFKLNNMKINLPQGKMRNTLIAKKDKNEVFCLKLSAIVT